jgi:hypothetical protein
LNEVILIVTSTSVIWNDGCVPLLEEVTPLVTLPILIEVENQNHKAIQILSGDD